MFYSGVRLRALTEAAVFRLYRHLLRLAERAAGYAERSTLDERAWWKGREGGLLDAARLLDVGEEDGEEEDGDE